MTLNSSCSLQHEHEYPIPLPSRAERRARNALREVEGYAVPFPAETQSPLGQHARTADCSTSRGNFKQADLRGPIRGFHIGMPQVQ